MFSQGQRFDEKAALCAVFVLAGVLLYTHLKGLCLPKTQACVSLNAVFSFRSDLTLWPV